MRQVKFSVVVQVKQRKKNCLPDTKDHCEISTMEFSGMARCNPVKSN